MPQLVASLMTSLDGHHETEDRSIAWAALDADFDAHSIATLDGVGRLLFGRVTYEGMAAYWPSEQAAADFPEVRRRMHDLPKTVFSSTLDPAGTAWAGTEVVNADAAAAVAALKARDDVDGELVILGSATLTASLLDAGLVDELRLTVHPRLLAGGHPGFAALARPRDLELLGETAFASGAVLLRYRPLADQGRKPRAEGGYGE